jgi:hypothetical protein
MNVAPGPVQSWKARTGPNSIGVFLTEDLKPILLGQQSSDNQRGGELLTKSTAGYQLISSSLCEVRAACKAVSNTNDGLDAIAAGAKFLAQPANMHVQRARVSVIGVAPNVI